MHPGSLNTILLVKVSILLSWIFFFVSCCTSETEFGSRGIITGPDLRMCACCGGWMIQIDSGTYVFDSLPVGSAIILEKESFPLAVWLDWHLKPNGCPVNRIIVERIRKA